jgi:prophage regulatory protein
MTVSNLATINTNIFQNDFIVKQIRLIRRPEVQEITGLSRSGIYARIDPDSSGFDPTFPKQINLGGRSVGWVLAEVEGWIAQRVAARDLEVGRTIR